MGFRQFANQTSEAALQGLATHPEQGITEAEAVLRLKKYGPNRLNNHEVYWWQILFRQFRSAFIYLLLGAAALAFFLGEKIDAGIVLLFITINTLLGFYQEFRSEQTVRLLKKYLVSRCHVKRDGAIKLIESQYLVPGDLVILETGDIIPADMRLISTQNLLIDESMLTGESVQAEKNCETSAAKVEQPFQASNIGFSGTIVISGQGVGVVFATGTHSELGNISKLVIEEVRISSFTKNIDKFSGFILRLVMVTLAFVFVVNLFIKGLSSLTELLLFSVALAVSVVPEALPVVVTFALSRGALNLAKKHVVAKRLSAIEDLGSIEVLCTDKTGTLTENMLVIDEVYLQSDRSPIFHAGLAAPFINEKSRESNNSFDLALEHRLSPDEKNNLSKYRILAELPFDPERKRNSVIVAGNEKVELIVRGAPEEIIKLSSNLDIKSASRIKQWTVVAGRSGKRVIAVAKKTIKLKKSFDFKTEETELEFLGLISFIDPLKDSSKDAIIRAKELGVQVKILTGDSPEVAGWVAKQVELISSDEEIIDGEKFDRLSAPEQLAAVTKHVVFARVSPQQKYQIIKLLEQQTEVGFLGEGINDAPALKAANVGIVVDGASDIARDAADIILLNKSLKSIIDGIAEGRIIFANTVKYIKATLTSNFGNFYAVATASLLIEYLPMLPMQLLLVNLLSDFPYIAVATDNVDDEELKKPRSYRTKEIALFATIMGVVSTVFDFIYFGLFIHFSPAVLQTNWFIGSILTELALIFSIRTRGIFYKGKTASWQMFLLIGFAACSTMLIPLTRFGSEIFKFQAPSPYHFFLIIGIALVYFAITETIKLLYYKHMIDSKE